MQNELDSDTGSEVSSARGPVARNRIHCTLTVHPKTLGRLDSLVRQHESSRGRIVDKLVQSLYQAYHDGKVCCIHGASCVAGRTDLPEIF